MLEKTGRHRPKDVIVPDSTVFKKLMAVTTTLEAAIYLDDRFTDLLERAGMSEDKAMKGALATIRSLKDYIKLATSGGDPWGGNMPSTEFQNFHQGMATIAAKLVQDKQVAFDYAVNDDSELLRAYSTGGVPLDNDSAAAMDIVYNAWLTKNDMFSQDGVIYEGMPGSKNPSRANPETLRDKLANPVSGFSAYARSKSIELQSNDYSAEERKEVQAPSARSKL